jgi:AcrR family transcriptional regulator
MKRAQISRKRPQWLAKLDDPSDERVLAAAFHAFAVKGFHGASMLEIATRARVSKKTLYERFRDKANLFRALLAWGCRNNLPEAPPPADGAPETALRAHAASVLLAMMRPESLALFRIVIAEAGRFPEIGRLFDEMTRTASAAIVKELARRLDAAGLYSIANRVAFAEDFIGLLRGDVYFRAAIGVVPPPSRDALIRHANRSMDMLLAAYRLSQPQGGKVP